MKAKLEKGYLVAKRQDGVAGDHRYCHRSQEETRCGDWCPLFVVSEKAVTVYCGCQPVAYEIEKPEELVNYLPGTAFCANCVHRHDDRDEYPCSSCLTNINGIPERWKQLKVPRSVVEPKATKPEGAKKPKEKVCDNCKHEDVFLGDDPCNDCDAHDNREPKA